MRVSSLSFAGQVEPATLPSREGPRHWVKVSVAVASAATRTGVSELINAIEKRTLSVVDENGRVRDIGQPVRAKGRVGSRRASEQTVRPAYGRCGADNGRSRLRADSSFSSAGDSARLKTATPPIQPVKPTLCELWITRPMLKEPPVPSLAGVYSSPLGPPRHSRRIVIHPSLRPTAATHRPIRHARCRLSVHTRAAPKSFC